MIICDALWVMLAIYNLSGVLLLTRTVRGSKDLPTHGAEPHPAG